ncbi:MAG: shikimate kinase [Alphaproteobacteria bacterium]
MKLSSKQFLAKLNGGELKLAFVGMSNIGKSFLARKIAKAYDMNLIEVDKMIWESLGFDTMDDFADWQGHPYEEDYKEREKELIELEGNATGKAIDNAAGNSLLDTTGSVIYVDPAIRRNIKENFYVVHIKAETSDLERLKWEYFDNPKPLIWRNQYKPRRDLTDRENIFECYPKLLMSRAKEYAPMADATITSRVALDEDLTAEEVIMMLKPPR